MDIALTLFGFGVIAGGIAAVPAVGMTLMYGSSRFLNFAYGEWMTLGAFLTLTFNGFMPLIVAIALAVGVVSVYGPVVNKVVFRPLASRHGLVLLVTSLGLSFIMQNAMRMVWGVEVRHLDTPPALNEGVRLGAFRFTALQLIILAAAVVVMAIIGFVLLRTDLGLKVRAAAENPDLARTSGVAVDRISAISWALASALAALGGILVALTAAFTPNLGFTLLLVVASAMILGGLGSAVGAVVGAVVLGVAMELSTLVITPALKPAVAFAVLVVVLMIRPAGLFGRTALT